MYVPHISQSLIIKPLKTRMARGSDASGSYSPGTVLALSRRNKGACSPHTP